MTLFTRDLLAQGLLEHEIRGQVRRGTLIRVRHGVYVRTDDADTAESRHLRLAGATWPGLRAPDSCLSHQTAGVIHGLPVPGNLLGPVHITRPGRGGSSTTWVRLHRGVVPEEHRLTSPHGVVSSVAWTVADLARVLPPIHGVAVADAALAGGLTADEVSGTSGGPTSASSPVMRNGDGSHESVSALA